MTIRRAVNAACESLGTAGQMADASPMSATSEEAHAVDGDAGLVQHFEWGSSAAKNPPSGGDVQDAEQPPAASERHWIAWQVPSRTVLASTPPSAQRALLKDGLLRTLEANGQRIPAKAVQSILCLAQVDSLAAIEGGPSAQGAAADVLRQHLGTSGARRRTSDAAAACTAAASS